jgi:hypothetical protein
LLFFFGIKPRKASVLSNEVYNLQEESQEEEKIGQFTMIKTWTLSSQITSLALYKCLNNQYLLVSQPGGNFVNLMASEMKTEVSL